MKNFPRIHQILIDSGYPESHASDWYIKIDKYQGNLIVPHYYDCLTRERAKIAVKSLLNRTDVYEVTVYSPYRNPISFYGRFNELSEYEWNYYFHRLA